MLDEDIFSLVAGKIKEAGTADPREVAKHFDILWIDLEGTIKGYAALYNNLIPAVGLNTALTGNWYMFGGWHELTHVFKDDIRDPDFKNGHADTGFFQQEVSNPYMPRQEKTANLVAADVTILDRDVEEVTNYNSPTLRSYRRMKAYQKALSNELVNLRSAFSPESTYLQTQMHDLRRKIKDVSETLSNMETEIVWCNYNKNFSEMAKELGVTERILRYKLEAMRLKGADFDPQELESYDHIFVDAI